MHRFSTANDSVDQPMPITLPTPDPSQSAFWRELNYDFTQRFGHSFAPTILQHSSQWQQFAKVLNTLREDFVLHHTTWTETQIRLRGAFETLAIDYRTLLEAIKMCAHCQQRLYTQIHHLSAGIYSAQDKIVEGDRLFHEQADRLRNRLEAGQLFPSTFDVEIDQLWKVAIGARQVYTNAIEDWTVWLHRLQEGEALCLCHLHHHTYEQLIKQITAQTVAGQAEIATWLTTPQNQFWILPNGLGEISVCSEGWIHPLHFSQTTVEQTSRYQFEVAKGTTSSREFATRNFVQEINNNFSQLFPLFDRYQGHSLALWDNDWLGCLAKLRALELSRRGTLADQGNVTKLTAMVHDRVGDLHTAMVCPQCQDKTGRLFPELFQEEQRAQAKLGEIQFLGERIQEQLNQAHERGWLNTTAYHSKQDALSEDITYLQGAYEQILEAISKLLQKLRQKQLICPCPHHERQAAEHNQALQWILFKVGYPAK